MKILIVTDAWKPQINGVVRTLEAIECEMRRMGHDIMIVGPEQSRRFSFPMPGYPEITLEFFAGRCLSKILDTFLPDRVHIATEGPLGWSMRRICLTRGLRFTTAYHSRFPEYIAARVVAASSLTDRRHFRSRGGVLRFFQNMTYNFITISAYSFLRRFHAPSTAVLVSTASMEEELRRRGFDKLARWNRGVDTEMFRPYGKDFPLYEGLPRPLLLYVGRVAREKSIPSFLELKTEGSKVVIGEGPDLRKLRSEYLDAVFLGSLEGPALARAFAAADLFVFPSATDTFGLVLLEACASGLRVAARPVPGPADIFNNDNTRQFAVLDDDLQKAVDSALALPDDPAPPRRFAEGFSWQACAREFYRHLLSA